MSLSEVKNLALKMTFARDTVAKEAIDLQELLDSLNRTELVQAKAKALVNTVLVESRKRVVSSIEKVVSSALNEVYGEGHRFEIDVVYRRGQPEVDYYIVDGNTRIQLKKPFIGKGGGKVTVAAFALQLAVIQYAGVSGTLFLDEITRYVDADAVIAVANLMKNYTEKTGRQIVNVTHHDSVSEASDITYKVSKKPSGVAVVKEVR